MSRRRGAIPAAVAAGALLVFLAYAVVLGREHRMTPGDTLFHTLARALHGRVAEQVGELVTGLGTMPVAAAAAAAAAVVLAGRGDGREALLLLAGFVLLSVAIHVGKVVVDRPRPPEPLARSAGRAYPSGHAAYSIVFVAAALAVARGLPRRTVLIAAAIVLAALVGLTRVYLRVHWWSDVVGGWALGIAIFGAVALAVDAMRHNWTLR